MADAHHRLGFEQRSLTREISRRQALLSALESYLMANRGVDSFEALLPRVRELAASTLAYSLADEATKALLVQLFELSATHTELLVPEPARQAAHAKTLLGAFDSTKVEAWVLERADALRPLATTDE